MKTNQNIKFPFYQDKPELNNALLRLANLRNMLSKDSDTISDQNSITQAMLKLNDINRKETTYLRLLNELHMLGLINLGRMDYIKFQKLIEDLKGEL